MATYATMTELLDALGIDDASSDAVLNRVLDAATRRIDGVTGRSFSLQTAATKTFQPTRAGVVDLPDLRTATTVTYDVRGDRTFTQTLTASDYQLYPLDGPPYRQLRIWMTSSAALGLNQVRIAGDWGYVGADGRAPTDVREACLILATRYYKRGEAPFGILAATDIGEFERISAEDPDVLSLLRPYMLTASGWVFA